MVRGDFWRGDHRLRSDHHLPTDDLVLVGFAMLALAGCVDQISVVVRQTLVQILTPDEKRGRVSAVNSLFIGTSNELGGFRSGIVAYLFTTPTFLGNAAATGAIMSIVTGGIGTILVVHGGGVDLAGDPQIRQTGVKS